LLLQSQTLDNAAWSLSSATISANVGVAPDGTTTADKLIPTNGADPAAANAAQLQQVLSVSSGTYNFSIFAKADGQNSVRIRENNSWGNFLNVNLTTGAFNIIGGNFNQFNNIAITAYGNGWYRICFTTDAGVTNFTKYSIRGGETGDGTKGVLLWGAQFELGAYATSYIPTTSAAVTRLADAASKTGISSLIGSTAGTVFIDATLNTGTTQNADIFLLKGAGTGAFVMFLAAASGNINLYLNTTGAVPTIKSGNNRGQRVKIAISYQSGSLVAYINGVQTLSTGYTIEPDLADLYINTNNIGTNKENTILSQFLLFKTRLTNAQLAELTTL
jgi:hypothetical protein